MTDTAPPSCPYCGDPCYITKHRTLSKTCGKQPCKSKAMVASMPPGHFDRITKMAHAKRRENLRTTALRPHELQLMTQGRYVEAAQLIRHRSYNAGWSAGRRGFHQRPAAKKDSAHG